MNETELETLLIRLRGDGSAYMQMLQQAEASSRQVAVGIEAHSKQIEAITVAVKGYAAGAMSALEGFGAKQFLTGAFNQFVSFESGVLKMTAAIQVSGREVGPAMEAHKAFAEKMRDLTGATKGEMMAMLTRAELMGLQGDAARKAVQDAIGLSKVTGQSAESMLMVAKAIQDGNPHMIHHMAALRGIKDGHEKLTKAQQMAVDGFKVAQGQMGSAENVVKRYTAAVKSLTKQFGEYVAEAVLPVLKWATKLIEQFGQLDDWTKRLVVSSAFLVAGILAIGPAMALVRGYVAPAVTLLLSGFGMAATAVRLLLNPVSLLLGMFKVASAIAVVAFNPVVLAVAAVAAVVALVIGNLGGLNSAWETVKQYSMAAWDKVKLWAVAAWADIQAAVARFLAWVKPVTDQIQAWFGIAWEGVKRNALPAYEAVKAAVLVLWEKTKDLYEATVGWARDFAEANAGPIAALGAVALAVGVAYVAFQLLTFAVTALHLEQLAALGVWALLKAAVLVATAYTAIYNGVLWAVRGTFAGIVAVALAVKAAFAGLTVMMVAQKVVLGIMTAVAWVWNAAAAAMSFIQMTLLGQTVGHIGLMTAWNAVVLVSKAVVWLLNAALTVTNILLGGGLIIAATVAVAAMAVAFLAAAAAVMALWDTAKEVYDVLVALPTAYGPIKEAIVLFEQWHGIIGDIVRAAKVDMALAWDIAAAAATLAIEQIRSKFPPLWEFIKEGFLTVAELCKTIFVLKFNEAWDAVLAKTRNTLREMLGSFAKFVAKKSAMLLKPLMALRYKAADDLDFKKPLVHSVDDALNDAIALATTKLERAAKTFEKSATEGMSAAEVEALVDLEILRASIPDEVKKDEKKRVEEAKKVGADIGKAFSGGAEKELKKFDAALSGSAEALHRVNDYREKLEATNKGTTPGGAAAAGGGVPGDLPAAGAAPAAKAEAVEVAKKVVAAADKDNDQLQEIIDIQEAVLVQLQLLVVNTTPGGPGIPIDPATFAVIGGF